MEREEKVVLDASVITKWYTKEKGSEAALRYRDMHVEGKLSIVEPGLFIYEVMNALNYNPNFNESDVEKAILSLLDLHIETVFPSEEMIKRTINIARMHSTSVYDSTYLALANLLKVQMITADCRFWEKAKQNPNANLLAM